MSLKDIFCQDKAIELLERGYAVGRLRHAYIFAGLDGVGKHATARQWAKLLLCKHPVAETRGGQPFADSCGIVRILHAAGGQRSSGLCPRLQRAARIHRGRKGRAPPVELPIDVVREFLIAQVPARPTLSDRRVFVVSEAQKLNANSQNALLKVLEEPPQYCTIILLCTRLEELLPTTKSRCQIVRFGPIDERIITDLLQAGAWRRSEAGFWPGWLREAWARPANGPTLDQAGASLFDVKRQIVSSLVQMQLADVLDLADQFLAAAKSLATSGWIWTSESARAISTAEPARPSLQIVISVFHDVMMLQVDPQHPLIHADQDKQIGQLAERLDRRTGRQDGERRGRIAAMDRGERQREADFRAAVAA